MIAIRVIGGQLQGPASILTVEQVRRLIVVALDGSGGVVVLEETVLWAPNI